MAVSSILFFFINFYCSIVDLQFVVVSGVQQSESILYVYIYIYVYTHTYTDSHSFLDSFSI